MEVEMLHESDKLDNRFTGCSLEKIQTSPTRVNNKPNCKLEQIVKRAQDMITHTAMTTE